MLRCQFCGLQVAHEDALQAHQVMDCPAVHQENYVQSQSTATVEFKWIMDRVIDHPEIHLIGSDLGDTIVLKKGNGSYTSSPTEIATGVFNAQLVIADDIIPVAEFEIEALSNVIYLVIDRDSSADDIRTSTQDTAQARPLSRPRPSTPPVISPPTETGTRPRRSSEGKRCVSRQSRQSSDSSQDGLSPLHRELLQHQIHNPVSMSLLQEENDFQDDDVTSPRHEGFVRSPDDHTLRNIEDLESEGHTAEPQVDRHHHEPQEDQQPVESEVEDSLSFNIASTESSPRRQENQHASTESTPRGQDNPHGETFTLDDDNVNDEVLRATAFDNDPSEYEAEVNSADGEEEEREFENNLLDMNDDFIATTDHLVEEREDEEGGFELLSDANSSDGSDDGFLHLKTTTNNDNEFIDNNDMEDGNGDRNSLPTSPNPGQSPSNLNEVISPTMDTGSPKGVRETFNSRPGRELDVLSTPLGGPLPSTSPPDSPVPPIPHLTSPGVLENPDMQSSLPSQQNIDDMLHELTMTDNEENDDDDDDENNFERHDSVAVETDDGEGEHFDDGGEHFDQIETLQSEPTFQPSVNSVTNEIEDAMQDIPVENENHRNSSSIPLDIGIDHSVDGAARRGNSPDRLQQQLSGGSSARSVDSDPTTRNDVIPDVLQTTDRINESPTLLPDQIPVVSPQHNQPNDDLAYVETRRRPLESGVGGHSGSGYASDSSSLAEQRISRQSSRESSTTTRRRRRTHSHSSQQSQVQQQEDDNIIADLKIKCDSYESELARMHQEIDQLNEENTELKTKCQSYEETVQQLTLKCAEMQETFGQERLQYADKSKKSQVEILEVNRRCQRYEEEVQKLKREYDGLLKLETHSTQALIKDEIISELEAKCQSYDIEIDRLMKENKTLKRNNVSSRRNEETERKIRDLQSRILELETINLKLTSDTQSIETAHKLHEENLSSENHRLKRKISELEKTISTSRVITSPATSDMSPETSRKNIEHLKTENAVLKEKLNNIRIESSVRENFTNGSSSSNAMYQPQIISPRTIPSVPSRKSTEHITNKYLRHGSVLPDRLERSSYTQPESSDSDEMTSSKHGYTPEKYSSFTGPKDLSSQTHHTKVSSSSSSSRPYSSPFLDTMNQRYSPEYRDKQRHSSSEYKNISYGSSYPDRTTDDLLAHLRSRNQDYTSSSNHYSTSSRKAKSRSLEFGLNEVGRSDEDILSSPRHSKHSSSLGRLPFCPTLLSDLTIGMKVSVNRTNGRLSRGVVKWIGSLPKHPGDYVGIELESETGKHNGSFEGRQYFQWKKELHKTLTSKISKKDRGVFVKFPKVIMAWK